MNRTVFNVITRKCVRDSPVVGDAMTGLLFLCVQRPTAIINQRMAESLRPPGPALPAPRRSTPLPPCTAAPPVPAPATTLPRNQVRGHWGSWDSSRVSFRLMFTPPSVCFFFVADSLLFNRIDERLRLARERRGELEKQNGAYLLSSCDV